MQKRLKLILAMALGALYFTSPSLSFASQQPPVNEGLQELSDEQEGGGPWWLYPHYQTSVDKFFTGINKMEASTDESMEARGFACLFAMYSLFKIVHQNTEQMAKSRTDQLLTASPPTANHALEVLSASRLRKRVLSGHLRTQLLQSPTGLVYKRLSEGFEDNLFWSNPKALNELYQELIISNSDCILNPSLLSLEAPKNQATSQVTRSLELDQTIVCKVCTSAASLALQKILEPNLRKTRKVDGLLSKAYDLGLKMAGSMRTQTAQVTWFQFIQRLDRVDPPEEIPAIDQAWKQMKEEHLQGLLEDSQTSPFVQPWITGIDAILSATHKIPAELPEPL